MIKISEFIALENAEFSRPGWPDLKIVLLFLVVLFFFQPVIAIVALAVFLCVLLEKPSLLLLIVLSLMVAVYLGLVNLTRLPESDLVNYLGLLTFASKAGFSEVMATMNIEPAYLIYIYSLANIPWSSDNLFIFLSTVIPYAIVLICVIRFGCKLDLPSYAIVAVLVFVAFSPPLFNNSAHLLRQFLVGALITWFYIDYTMGRKNRWWLLLLALLTHTTAIIFLPLALVGSFRRYSVCILLSIMMVLFMFDLLLLKFISPYMTTIPYLGDIINRAMHGVYWDHAPLGLKPLLLLCLVSLFSLYKLVVGFRSGQLVTRESGVNLYISSLILCLFILWAYLADETMLATRFMLYVYFLLAPILSLAIADAPKKKWIAGLVIATMPVYFVYTILYGVWTYERPGLWVSLVSLMH
jgi:hypothetical protein